MSEYVTVKQVETRYPKEWVLLGDVKYDQKKQVLGGVVLYHGPNREEMYQVAIKLKPKTSATIPPQWSILTRCFTGPSRH